MHTLLMGWESELTENYSGIVDCFHIPKSDPAIIARYNCTFVCSGKDQ